MASWDSEIEFEEMYEWKAFLTEVLCSHIMLLVKFVDFCLYYQQPHSSLTWYTCNFYNMS